MACMAFRTNDAGDITGARDRTIACKKEKIMGKGNNSQKNDKKSKKPKQNKLKGMKAGGKK